jgi:hypothetical protein
MILKKKYRNIIIFVQPSGGGGGIGNYHSGSRIFTRAHFSHRIIPEQVVKQLSVSV